MRLLRSIAIVAACAAGMVAAHGQVGGDEPGDHAQTASPAPVAKPRAVRISSGVMQGLLLKKVAPVYPAYAHIEGTVMLHAIIGKNGHIESLEAVSGSAMLQGAALDAVRQWVYKPYLLNGEPVEVDTTVNVNFSPAQSCRIWRELGPCQAQPDQHVGPVRISGGVMKTLLVKETKPYSDPTIDAQGTVVVHVIIAKNGNVERAEVISGTKILWNPALAAVRQWQYTPYRLNGKPVEVDTVATVDFRR